jgi:RNA polymerase sigma-70 factor (ECF subfamily)
VDAEARAAIEERFHHLLDVNRAALARLAGSYTRSPSDRMDLLQEIAMALWQALPRFRGDCSERTFLFRIAHNRCLARVAARRATIALDDEHVEVEDPRPGADVQLSRDEQRERLVAAVRQLPAIYREVITLTLEGMAYKEISAVLGISETNVGVRLNRARQLLKSILEGRA